MNRNSETYFSTMPTIEMQRSTFDLSHSSITTFNVGDVIPLTKPIEVYPGDTFEVSTTKVVRLQTLLSPIFGALYLDLYWFYVPNRIVHDNWPGVMGENMTGPWAPSVSYTTPLIQSGSSGFDVGSIEDHYGLPVGVGPVKVNALPIRGYASIWDNYFRSQDLQYPLNIYKGDATKYTTALDPLAETNMTPRKACRMHDYFSSCQPAPLKALNPVLIPMSGAIPVVTKTDVHDQDTPVAAVHQFINPIGNGRYLEEDPNTLAASFANNMSNNASYPTNLWAEVIPGIGTQQGVVATINDLRTAFQIQRMLERDAMSGSRYRETILAHFSVSTGDARMQIPEYLGGNRCTLNIQQVVNNSESASYKLGNTGAMSHTVDSHADFIKSFVEHGFLHCLGVVRFSNDYAQGMDRLWSRSDRYSYYWPSLAFIGAQAVKNKEIFTQGNLVLDPVTNEIVDDQVFGYQEAWAELRQIPNQVSALMRPQVTGTLASWNLADDYGATLPTLSDGWIKSDETTVDRVLAVKSTTSDQMLGNFYFDIKATRVLPMFSVPGLIDHF